MTELEAAEGNTARGAARYDEMLRLVSAANPKPEIKLDDAVKLSALYGAAAQLHRRAGHTDSAAALEARRLNFQQYWVTVSPNNAFIQRLLEPKSRP